MNIPIQALPSRDEFSSDASYQQYYKGVFRGFGLDDGYSYTINLWNGGVKRLGKMKLETEKLSKSTGGRS